MPCSLPLEFVIPGSFAPTRSLLGRTIRRRTGDRLRAEGVYVNIVTIGAVMWLLASFAAWSLLAERIEADPDGRTAVLFFAAQIAVPLIGVLVAGVGFHPEIRIRLDESGLSVRRGTVQVNLPSDQILAARVMDAVTYHRGLRLLASTRPFINRPVERVLVIRAAEGTLVLGLPADDLEALAAALKPSAGQTIVEHHTHHPAVS